MIARGRAAAQEQAHSLVIDGTRVELVLRRSARRSFALQVDHRGARAAVPLRTPLGEEANLIYDAGGRLRQTVFPDGSIVQTTYDIFGNMSSTTDPDGRKSQFECG